MKIANRKIILKKEVKVHFEVADDVAVFHPHLL